MNLISLLLIASTIAAPPSFGHLWPTDRHHCGQITRCESTPYCPEEGDIVIYTSRKLWQSALFWMARTGEPFHSGIVTRDCDGTLKILEAGPKGMHRVVLLDVVWRFHHHLTDTNRGIIWVRRLRCTLRAEQSARLTQFAQSQLGKHFAGPRLAWHATVFNERTPLIRRLVPDANPHQSNWFCSEIVVEAMRAAGTIPADAPPGNAIMPRNLFTDHGIDLSATYDPPMRWTYANEPITPGDSAADARAIPLPPCQCEPHPREQP